MSQNSLIRADLEAGKSLTPLSALQDYGCFRLAARIKNLRDKGLLVKTERVTKNSKQFARYSL